MNKLIKNLILVMSLMIPTSLYAQQATVNSIYITQVGNSSTIDLKQQGQGNSIGTEQAPVSLQGNAQTITVLQDGNNNTIDGKIEQADNINYDITTTGAGNALVFDHGDSSSVAGSNLVLTVTGDSNALNLTQGNVSASSGADQHITIAGDQNIYTSTINTTDVVNKVVVSGDQNQFAIVQNGHSNKNIDLSLTGSNNNYVINQKSTTNVDSININSASIGSTVTINQCNPGGCSN